MTTKTASLLIGFTFLAVGLLGFVPNPLIGDTHNAIFHTDAVHNLVHIISGALFVLVALAAPERAATFLKVFGAVYFLLGVIGLVTIGSEGMTMLLGFLAINGADNYLHLGLGIGIFLASMLPRRRIAGIGSRI
ncbi:DUF4383 domain-containing protein [Rufibacter glacialis]|uniref:DUF4383 domain-containing protein n=1 Tax=Rufibacter glacialis TaxID=1259555 RepID=A0A5M8QNR0_9BACT|nr:DUF4383 domain-containing protein [Rufibacter glacialis]KAA6437775.1 DUF4383 domain-containing protein [Rufibacter glacialis]GGK56399.1 membrane protein [Rufibacter glacialis]